MNTRRLARRALATAALTMVAAQVIAVVAPVAGTAAQVAGPLRVLGSVPVPNGPARQPNSQASIVQVDAASRRMFMLYTDGDGTARIVTYDISGRIPRQVGIGALGHSDDFPITNPYTVAYDSRRRHLAFIAVTVDAAGHPIPTGTASVVTYSVATNKVVDRWNLSTKAPGFFSMGITYSAADDRYYAVGEFSGQQYIVDGTPVFGSKAAGPGSAVVALGAADGEVRWGRVVSECQQVLFSKGIASLIARSRVHDAVYFACVSGGTALGQTYPGQAGLVRLHIDPDGDTAAAQQRPAEFFAISGNYFSGGKGSGVAAFDETTDRFYLQSISFRTPGAWVFDGKLTAWVGFVASKSNANFFIGVNPGIGHLYIGTQRGTDPPEPTDGLLVADVRQTPVPAGEFTQLITSNLIVTDPGSNRLFVRPNTANDPYLVVEDVTEVTKGGLVLDNYDADTSGSADTPANDIFYAIGATGYAAQFVQVGGTGAPGTALGPGSPEDPADFDGSTRALMNARVGSIDLRSDGASASAQSALPDLNTLKEYEGRGQAWPYPSGTCLDAGGRPVDKSWRDETGRTDAAWSIKCDVGKNSVQATVRMGSSNAGGVTTAKSAYEVVATRNTTDGAVVDTKTSVSSVVFDLAGGYSVKLGQVAAATHSVAHGRPGTAKSTWTRDVDGIRVLDPLGKTIFNAPGCMSKVDATSGKPAITDTCVAVGQTINKVLPTRLRVDFPIPDVTATPKGAFAGVEQSTAQYFQQAVVNDQGVVYRGDSVGIRPAPAMITETYTDTTERSRTVSVLAATQANAVFQANPPFVYEEPPPGPVGPVTGTGGSGQLPGVTTGNAPSGGGDTDGAAPPPQAPGNNGTTTAIPTANVSGWFFMRRSFGDTALLLLLSGLMLGGAGTMWRRRRLVEVLVTVPRKEAAL